MLIVLPVQFGQEINRRQKQEIIYFMQTQFNFLKNRAAYHSRERKKISSFEDQVLFIL